MSPAPCRYSEKHIGSLLLLGNIMQVMPQQNLLPTLLKLPHSQMSLLFLGFQLFPRHEGAAGQCGPALSLLLTSSSVVNSKPHLLPPPHQPEPPTASCSATRAPSAGISSAFTALSRNQIGSINHLFSKSPVSRSASRVLSSTPLLGCGQASLALAS